jgi:hypothetical protein
MKTFQQFCEQAYNLQEIDIKSLPKKAGRAFGADIAGEVVKKVTGNKPIINKVVDVATSGVGLGRVAGPAAVGYTIGTEVLAPAAKRLAQQRRDSQQARYTSLIPSGKTDVSGKPAQIKPLNR